ncbi:MULTISPECIES: GNAT family N-acetyltransferase [unclassified Pseudomonas]|uniref:GNAT family N-acetyltransferase n=1 Tax=unclassified Pseudomonas TaxID=196821 RepID=UPI0021C95685|nr:MULTISPECIES: GNAT family N-acetyltransferase [unclassified Pseudomonas]MCU1732926.1 GNAT family N-acetyltransferase [Pseudomonas sp. 20P_3.2_Bac4]MCU1742408.1 GNAT family N-acetyltransferase [Pseudomonas sp. 20P_3.2_Bac5]
MPVVTLLQTPPEEPLKSQLLQWVVDDFSQLSSTALPPSNPLYNLYQYGLGFEVHLYLEALGGSRLPVELLLACDDDDPQQLHGFALCLPIDGEPGACAVAWMAVRPDLRRRGIARSLLDHLRQRYNRIELACGQGKVPCFEALGFAVAGVRDTQVLMASGAAPGDGVLLMLDVAPVWRTVEVQQIHSYLLKQHGRKAMVEAEKKRDRHLDELSRHARAFVLERIAQVQVREIRLV